MSFDRNPPRNDPQPMTRKMELWTPDQLRDQIKLSCINDEPGVIDYELLPSNLEIGVFGKKALTCRDATMADSQHRERAAALYWEPGRRSILIPHDDKLLVGTEAQVMVQFQNIQAQHTTNSRDRYAQRDAEVRLGKRQIKEADTTLRGRYGSLNFDSTADPLDKLKQQSERERMRQARLEVTRPIGLIHSHPSETTFSGVDLTTFLDDPDFKIFTLASSDGALRAFVATSQTKWILKDNQAIREVEQDVVRSRYDELAHKDLEARVRGLNALERIHYSNNEHFRDSLQRKSDDAVLALIAAERKFGYYVGDETSPKLRRLVIKSREAK